MRDSSGGFAGWVAMLVISVLMLVTLYTVRIVWGISFSLHCSQYLQRAANANTVDLAKSNLAEALKYLDSNGLTNGVVSVFFRQPRNDIGYWHSNLASALQELEKVGDGTTQLERTNLLMKLRETLMEHSGDSGKAVVTCPDGISAYPHNKLFFWLFVISGAGACVSVSRKV